MNPKLNPKAAKLSKAIATPGILFAMLLDEANHRLYGAGTEGFLYEVDYQAEKPTAVKKHELHANYVSGLVRLGDVLISASYDHQLRWTDFTNGKQVRTIDAHRGWVRRLALTPDGQTLVSIGDDMAVKLWQTSDGKALATLTGHQDKTPEGYTSGLYALAISPDGRYAATGDRAGFVHVWDIRTAKESAAFRAADFYTFDALKRARAIGGIRGLTFSADGSRLVLSGIGAVTNVDGFVGPCRMEVWDWKAGKRLVVGQEKHQAILNHVAWNADHSWLIAVGGGDGGGVIACWPGNETTMTLAKPKGHLQTFQLGKDGTLYTAGHAGFQVWSLT